jgi:hypothetical protein
VGVEAAWEALGFCKTALTTSATAKQNRNDRQQFATMEKRATK